MQVEYSKSFIKSVKKLSGKRLKSVQEKIKEVKKANAIEDISNCVKLTNFESVYRIRIGNLRAFFVYHIVIENNVVFFQYLTSRGEAYNKKSKAYLRKKDQ